MQAGTTLKYLEALIEFRRRLDAAQVDWLAMSESERDWYLADDILELKDDPDCAVASGGDLISALSKLDPHCRLPVAWKVFEAWRKDVPIKQAICLPPEMISGMACLACALGRQAVGMAMMVCYAALLRARECLCLKGRDVILSTQGLVLSLGKTKRGVAEKVVITHPLLLSWMRAYLAWRSAAPDDFVFPVSYGTFLYWTKRIPQLLGFEPPVTTHSFRRSGASELCRMGVAYADICLYGRWSSEKAAREYIRRGEAELVKALPGYASVLRRCSVWTKIGPLHFFKAQAPQAVQHLARRRVTPDLIAQLEVILDRKEGGHV